MKNYPSKKTPLQLPRYKGTKADDHFLLLSFPAMHNYLKRIGRVAKTPADYQIFEDFYKSAEAFMTTRDLRVVPELKKVFERAVALDPLNAHRLISIVRMAHPYRYDDMTRAKLWEMEEFVANKIMARKEKLLASGEDEEEFFQFCQLCIGYSADQGKLVQFYRRFLPKKNVIQTEQSKPEITQP